MKKRELAKQVAIRITPYVALKRSVVSTAASVSGIGASFRAYGRLLRRRWDQVDEIASKDDPRESFEHFYTENKWTESSLIARAGALRITRFLLLLLGTICVPLVLMIFLRMPFWMAAFLGPLCMSFAVALFSVAARYCWWECQIELRALISFKTFVGREDFWRRLFT